MDPNTNQPFAPQPGRVPEPRPLPGASTPDWQQGLGQPLSQPQPARALDPSVPGPAVGSAPAGMPTNMPAQPQPWQPPSSSAPGEISMTTPGIVDYEAVAARKRKMPVIVAGIAVLLLLAGITYFAFFRGNDSTDNNGKQSNQAAGEADMAALESAALEPPETIEGYTSRQTGTAAIKDYVSADGNCEFILGTVTAAQLPGDNLETLIKPQLEQLRQAGASVKGPDTAAALLVKDATDSSKTYRMPTLAFEFSQDKKHAIVHYSAVIMKNGDRAVINRACLNENGEADKNKMKALDAIAQKVMVRPGLKR